MKYTKGLKAILACFLVSQLIAVNVIPTSFALSGGDSNPDSTTGGYMFTDSSEQGGPVYEWNEINNKGVLISQDGDDQTFPYGDPISIGFEFPFFDKTFSAFKFTPNGAILFDADNNFSESNYFAKCFLRDLVTNDNSKIYKYYDENLSETTIEFDNVQNYGNAEITFSFQTILRSSGDVQCVYKDIPAQGNNPMIRGFENKELEYTSEVLGGSTILFYKNPHRVRLSIDDSKTVSVRTETTISGTGTTSAEDDLSYNWSLTSSPEGSQVNDDLLQGKNTSRLTFTPDKQGDYEFSLTATNASLEFTNENATNSVTVHVYGTAFFPDSEFFTPLSSITPPNTVFLSITDPNFTYTKETLTGTIKTTISGDEEDVLLNLSGSGYFSGPIITASGDSGQKNNGILEIGAEEGIQILYTTPKQTIHDFSQIESSPGETLGYFAGEKSIPTTKILNPGELSDYPYMLFGSGNTMAFGKMIGRYDEAQGNLASFQIHPTGTLAQSKIDLLRGKELSTNTQDFYSSNGVDFYDYHTYRNDIPMNVFSIQSGSLMRNEITFDDYYKTPFGTTLNIPAPGVLGNDLALFGGTLSVILTSKPAKGTMLLNSDGSFVYTPYPKETGKDTFRYLPVENGIWGKETTVTIDIATSVGIKALGLYYNTPKNIVLESGVQFEYLNYNGNFSRLELVTPPQHGTIVFPTEIINGVYLSYTPEEDYVGDDTFSYKVIGSDLTESNTVESYISVYENDFHLNPQTDNYILLSGQDTLVVQDAASGVLGNDTNDNGSGSGFSVFLKEEPYRGTVDLHPDGSFIYTRTDFNPNFTSDYFQYVVWDGSQYANGYVNIAYEADTSETNELYFTTKINTTLRHFFGYPDSRVITVQPEHGSIQLTKTNYVGDWRYPADTYDYIPDSEYSGLDSFTYQTVDNGITSTVTLFINVNNETGPESGVGGIESMTLLGNGLGAILGGAANPVIIYNDISASGPSAPNKMIQFNYADGYSRNISSDESGNLYLFSEIYDPETLIVYKFNHDILTGTQTILQTSDASATYAIPAPGYVNPIELQRNAKIQAGYLWFGDKENNTITRVNLDTSEIQKYTTAFQLSNYFVDNENGKLYATTTSYDGVDGIQACSTIFAENEWNCTTLASQLDSPLLQGKLQLQTTIGNQLYLSESKELYIQTEETILIYSLIDNTYSLFVSPENDVTLSDIETNYSSGSVAYTSIGEDDDQYFVTHPESVPSGSAWSGWNQQIYQISLTGTLLENDTIDIGWKGYNTKGECNNTPQSYNESNILNGFNLVPSANAEWNGMNCTGNEDFNDIYLEIYNHTTGTWDMADSRLGNNQFTDFSLHRVYPASEITPYLQNELITYRVREYEFTANPEIPRSLHTNYVYLSKNTNTNLVVSLYNASSTPVVNHMPILDPIGNKTVNEDGALSFTTTATDSDIPSQTLTYSLDPSAATGATIDPDTGVFTWTPTEEQGPGTYNITVTVTDDGSPNLTDSETIQITVTEANIAPVLDGISDQTVEVNNLLTFATHATDNDIPVNTLSFSLVSTLTGATIDPNTGVFTWTPDGSQGPLTYTGITIRVTDNGTPDLYDEKTFTITVTNTPLPPTNIAPILTNIGNKTVDEGVMLSFTASSVDADIPAQTLVYSLDSGSPVGSSIDPNTGVFTWTPTEAQGPGTYNITVRVTDDGSPILDDFETIQVMVGEVNSLPVLDVIGDQIVEINTPLSVPTHATDTDIPTQTLSYSLDSTNHTGATIDPSTGVFTWTPTNTEGTGSFTAVVRVTDNGTPALFSTGSFKIDVIKTPDPINGACGSDNTKILVTNPVNLCDSGISANLTFTGSAWNWSCDGLFLGTNATCSANKAPDPINGVCGNSNGGLFTTKPISDLCAAGMSSVVTDTLPWSWTCVGSNSGSTLACSANQKTSGGGGGGSVVKDICPDGDYSSSYYDGSCGTLPKKPVTLSGITVEDLVFTGTINQVITGALVGSGMSGSTLSYQAYIQSATGTLKVSTGGIFQYTPEKDYLGAYKFTYRATDGKMWSNTGVATIQYIPVVSSGGGITPTNPKLPTSPGGGGSFDSAPSSPGVPTWPENVYIKNMCNYSDLDYGQIEFSDIQGNIHEKQITILLRNCIVNGVDYTRFAPSDYTTRAEALKMILRSSGVSYDFFSTQSSFSDVLSPSWQVGLVQKGYEMDIIQGETCGEGKICFRPNEFISMQELLKILMRTLQLVDKNKQFINSSEEFDFYMQEAKRLNLFANIEDINSITQPNYTPTRDIVSQVVVNAFEKKYQISTDTDVK